MTDDRIRGFPAFPPAKRHGRVARTWWGNAWVKALEDTSLDQEPLRRGRAYAYAGRVGSVTVSPGRLAAPVEEPEATYQTRVFVHRLGEDEWARFLDEVAAKAGHLAALLDGEMPRDLVRAAADAGVPLLPGLGDLEPECDCDDWELPCRHAAALCYQAAWLVDADPFVLTLLRGRSASELVDGLQRRAPAPPAAAVTPVAAAYAAEPAPLPEPLPPVTGPVTVPEFPAAPGVTPGGLALLVTDAAARARALLVGAAAPALDRWRDAVRLAAAHPEAYGRLAGASGRPAEFAIAVRAWTFGGAAGLDVLESAWIPPAAELARARTALAAAWEGEEPAADRNRWTLGELQLRYGPDGRWYPYRADAGAWWPAGPPDRDPAGALAALPV